MSARAEPIGVPSAPPAVGQALLTLGRTISAEALSLTLSDGMVVIAYHHATLRKWAPDTMIACRTRMRGAAEGLNTPHPEEVAALADLLTTCFAIGVTTQVVVSQNHLVLTMGDPTYRHPLSVGWQRGAHRWLRIEVANTGDLHTGITVAAQRGLLTDPTIGVTVYQANLAWRTPPCTQPNS